MPPKDHAKQPVSVHIRKCQSFFAANPGLTNLLVCSCFAYSSVGLGLMCTASFLPPSYSPFTHSGAYFCLGASLFIQGPLSCLGDVHSVIRLSSGDSIYCKVDRIMATVNAAFAFLAFAGVHVHVHDRAHRVALAALAACWTIAVVVTFPLSKRRWEQLDMKAWAFWHMSWHFVPCGLTLIALVVLSHHHLHHARISSG